MSRKGETPIVTEEAISDDSDILDSFNTFFVNIVLNLNIKLITRSYKLISSSFIPAWIKKLRKKSQLKVFVRNNFIQRNPKRDHKLRYRTSVTENDTPT